MTQKTKSSPVFLKKTFYKAESVIKTYSNDQRRWDIFFQQKLKVKQVFIEVETSR